MDEAFSIKLPSNFNILKHEPSKLANASLYIKLFLSGTQFSFPACFPIPVHQVSNDDGIKSHKSTASNYC